jgi:TonB-linked SusC/RagA family outer membrane protein
MIPKLLGRRLYITVFVLLLAGLAAVPAASHSLLQQPAVNRVTGKVTDQQGDPVAGVTVAVKGTSLGTTTDDKGAYSLGVTKGQTLAFSYIGYQVQEIVYTGQGHIDVTLEPSSTQLKEVVAVGYGTQKKESVVGAIDQVSGDDILKQDVPEVANALAGLLPGVETIQTTSIPGGSGPNDQATQIFIRGRSSWNNSQPLILVDGVPRSLNDIDPYDIDKISVLKDASATAVFGVKGANGVVLITTKRGREGKTHLSLNATMTANTISEQPNVLGSYAGNMQKDEAILNEVAVNPSSWADYVPARVLNYYRTGEYPDLYPDVNWMKAFTKDYSLSQNVNLGVRGGSRFVKYFGSLSYLHQGGLIKTADYGQGYNPSFNYNRFNFRSNMDFNVTPTTKISVNLSGMYGIQQSPNGNSSAYATFWKSLYGHPPDLYPIRYSDGTWADNPAFDKYLNPITAVNFYGLKKENRTRITSDLILKQDLDFITRGLSVTGRLSYDNFFVTEGPDITDIGVVTKYIPPSVAGLPQDQWDKYTIYNYPSAGEADGYNFSSLPPTYQNEYAPKPDNTGQSRATDYQVNLNYQRTFGEHQVSGMMLFKRRQSADNQDFLSYEEDWVGRLTYSYGSRYLLEFNGAYTGSEKFSRKYRFGFFPSVGLGWVVSEETFFKKAVPFVNFLKLRYSNGKVGNDQGIARWQYISNWNPLTNTWRFGAPFESSTGIPVTLEGDIANPDIHWETDYKQNAGLDAEFLKGALSLTFDYFWNHNTGIFVSAAQRTSNDIFGAPLPAANIGETETRGWEADISYKHQFSRNFSVRARYTQSFAKDRIIHEDDPELLPAYQKKAGYPINQLRSQVNQPGLIQSWDQVYTGVMGQDNSQALPGDFRQVDYNADGVIDQNDAVPFGYSDVPQYTHSLLLDFTYKGFDARILFYGVWNVSMNTNYDAFNEGYTVMWNFIADHAWNPEAGRTTAATYPGLRLFTTSDMGNWGVEDGSYTRIKSAALGYTFHRELLRKWKMSNLRISLQGYNLALWSKMREDREAQSGGLAMRTLSYPLTRSYTLGLSVDF